jgi:hypothetical protein
MDELILEWGDLPAPPLTGAMKAFSAVASAFEQSRKARG